MRLKNKKTGEIIDLDIANIKAQFGGISVIPLPIKLDGDEYVYNSLAELNEEWEDYKEPKEYWYVDSYGMVVRSLANDNEWDERRKAIGNYFETKEEAEKAVEKLKAWKGLKDAGFKFKSWTKFDRLYIDEYRLEAECIFLISQEKDLNLLFGGEE